MKALTPRTRVSRRLRATAVNSSSAPAAHGADCTGIGRALVVRNSAGGLGSLTQALEDLKLAVREASRGVEAVTVARSWNPHIVFLDIQLQDAPGREVASWLRSHPAMRSTPIVLLGDETQTVARPLSSSDFVFLNRSSSTPDFRMSISEALRHRPTCGDAT